MDDFISLPEEDKIKNQLNLTFSKGESLIPFTIGTSQRPNEEVNLLKTSFKFNLTNYFTFSKKSLV